MESLTRSQVSSILSLGKNTVWLDTATKLLASIEVPCTAKLPIEGGFREKMTFELNLKEAGTQKVVKRKVNFPSRISRVFREKTLLKLYTILELICSSGYQIFLT